VAGRQPVATPARGGGHGHDRAVELDGPGGAEEAGVAKAEDSTVGGGEPVTGAGGRGGHGHDRLVEAQAARRAEEAGAPEAEHPAVGSDQPGAGGGRDAGAGSGTVGSRARPGAGPWGSGGVPRKDRGDR